MAQIEVSRYQALFSWKSYRYGYQLWIDGVKKEWVSRYGNGRSQCELAPGYHSLQIKTTLGIMVSQVKEFDIREGKTMYFQVRNNPLKVIANIVVLLASFLFFMSLLESDVQMSDGVMYLIILVPSLIANLFFKNNAFIIVETDSQGNELI